MVNEKYIAFLQDNLSQKRIKHSQNVAEKAVEIARRFNVDEEKAYLAGLLHDAAREISYENAIIFLKKNNYSFCEEDYIVPEVLHGPMSAFLLMERLDLRDKEILQAVTRHTTGDRNMTYLDAVIFMADMVEPKRDYPGVEQLRDLTEKDLFVALLTGLRHTITYLLSNNKLIHPRTIATYNSLLISGKLQR